MADERKTFTEWENIYGIATFNVEREDMETFEGAPLRMTFIEFEQRVAACLARRRPVPLAATYEMPRRMDGHQDHAQPSRTVEAQPDLRLPRRRRSPWLFVLATFPTLATLLVGLLVRLIERFVRVRWLVAAGFLLADLLILIIQPIAATLSGPGYLWYQALNFIYQHSARGWAIGQHALFNRSLNLTGADRPVFSSVHLGGSPLNLYFGLSQAIVSSLFWATTLVFAKVLFRELRRLPAGRAA